MKKLTKKWFSIIEILIAIFIFSITMASIFMIINSSINIDSRNKDQIIASNLARESIEILRNIRDNNYTHFRKWNYIPNSSNDFSKTFETEKYYKIENDFSSPNYPFKIEEITNFWEWKSELKWKMQNYKLYLDSNNHYTYNNTSTWTIFYRYVHIEKLKDDSWNIIPETMKVTSKVIWYKKWYHQFEIKTILANFNRY